MTDDTQTPEHVNFTIPAAVAALPPAEPSVTVAPDGTLVVTKTEIEQNPNATISLGRKILAAGEHAIHAMVEGPRSLLHARALPLADEFETLHEVEHLVIASFMDVGDVVRKVYLNALGLFVKA